MNMSEPEIIKNNSAGRLVKVLHEIAIQQQPSAYIISSVKSVIKIKTQDKNCIDYYSLLLKSIFKIEEELIIIPEQKRLNYLHTLKELKKIILKLSINSSYKWRNVEEAFKNTKSYIFRDLENMAYDISEYKSDEKIENRELEKIQKEVSNLINKIRTIKIDKELKFILLEKLNKIEKLIDNYELWGSDAIKNELEDIVKKIMFCDSNKISSDEDKNFVLMVLDWVFKTLSALSATKNILPEGSVEMFNKLKNNILPPGN